MGDRQHNGSNGSLDGMDGESIRQSDDGQSSSGDDSMPSMRSSRNDEVGAPEEKSRESVSGGIPIDMPAPILKDVPVSRPSPDGIDSSMSRSVSSFKAIRITKVYKAQ